MSEVGGRRELTKMSFGGGASVDLETLDSLETGNFDQFKKKNTTYSDSLYTTEINENKITQK
jgi:hypothetical protein